MEENKVSQFEEKINKSYPNSKHIVLPANKESSLDASSFVEGFLESIDANMKVIMQINIAIDEIFSNIVKFAYGDNEGLAALVIELSEDSVFKLTFMDNGDAFNPLEKEDPDVALDVSERSIGGLGIFIVKQTMDDLYYKYEDNFNLLTLVKKL